MDPKLGPNDRLLFAADNNEDDGFNHDLASSKLWPKRKGASTPRSTGYLNRSLALRGCCGLVFRLAE
jgi:hypothetical protein